MKAAPPPQNTILLVDDEESIRRIFSLTLTDDGYAVTTAGDGPEALRKFRADPPDIVITDIKMPGMSGVALLETIKTERPDTEVIMITGHGDMQAAIESLKKDAVDFIVKPIDEDVLAIALKRAHERIDARRRLIAHTRNLETTVAEKVAGLEQSRRRYRQLFDENPCYITVQDRDLRIVEANRRFLEDFGGAVARHCYAAYKQQTQPCPDCPVMATFADGLPHQSEMRVVGKDGAPRHLFISTAPLPDDRHPLSRVIEMSTDITQLRLLQDRLASLGLHAGSVSHAIKALLTHLDAGLYQLNTGLRADDRPRMDEGMQIINRAASRIQRMIMDVLYYAKERPLTLERVDVPRLARETASQFTTRLKQQPVRLELRVDETIPPAQMDAAAMKIALVNLLDNALDACLERTDNNSDLRIVFGVAAKADYTLFEVVDNGVGMDKQTIDNLFDLFFSSKGSRGTGLGLFVAHRIVTQHGGTIHVTSQKGQGAHFRIVLPSHGEPPHPGN